jgi:filamentous hemagglutinin family protein
MNSNYKLVYSEALNTWVAVAEHVSARGKKSALRLVTAAAFMAGGAVGTGASLAAPPLITPPAVNQLPTGAQVAAGTVSFSQTQTATAASMAVQQSSNQAIVNWQSFNVGANAKVNITQPNSTSVLLNRVQSSDPSQIFGQINANGQVLLLNPNGVYFAPGSRVDVGSFTASTHSISDADFLNGKHQFNRNGATGSILNEGQLSAGLGGYIALLAPEVRNLGVVLAQMGGTVALAAGESYELQFGSNKQLTNVLVTPATIQTLVDNGQAVQAPGGLIILSAQAASGLLGGVVKNSGSISATGLVNDGGTIRLSASHKIELAPTSRISADAAPSSAGNGGRIDIITDLANATGITQVDGSISAKGGEQGGDGGFVDTSAARLDIGENTLVTTGAAMGNAGTWLLDPYDITIEGPSGTTSGTAYADSFTAGATSTILASSISASLNAGSNVTISTGTTAANTVGSITVNGPITWSTAKTLTLSANYNININAAIMASAASGAGVVLEYNQGNAGGVYDFGLSSSGFAGSINFGGNANTFSTKNYTASATNYQVITSLGATTSTTAGELYGINGGLSGNYALGSNINAGGALTALATSASPFTGKFEGLGHNITATSLSCTDRCGLFSTANSPLIQNLGLNLGTTNTGQFRTGAVVGSLTGGTISNVFSNSSVSGSSATGGLVGYLTGGTLWLSNSYMTGTVGSSGSRWVGGLIGYSYGTAYISNSYVTGAVGSSATDVGGLVGNMVGGVISNSYATGNVSSSAANASTTSVGTGGLIGTASASITIINSYSSGNISAPNGSNVGGVVGYNAGKVINTYASGSVSGTSNKGGVVGNNTGTVTGSYWNTTTSGLADGIGAGTLAGATGLTSSEMQQQASFTALDFSQLPIWAMGTTGNLNPVLSGTLGNIFLGATGGAWSTASNWSLGATPVDANGGIAAVINSGTTVNYDTGTAGSLARSIYNAGTISFSGSTAVSLDGTIAGTGALVNTSTSVVTLNGSNTFSGGSSLTSGTLTAASANALGTGAVSIGAAGKLNLTYSGTVALGSTLSMSSGASITNSANTSSLSVAGASTLAGSINTAGNQTYSGAVTLGANTSLTTLNTSNVNTNGTVTFGATVNSASGNDYGLTVSNGTGTTAFGGVVGGTNPLAYLCINAASCTATSAGTSSGSGTTTLAGDVTTSGTQTYGGNLTLGTNTALTSTANSGNGTVTIAGNVNSSSSVSNGILQFLGNGYWEISTNSGSTWAYYFSNGSGSTYQSSPTISGASYTSTASALSSPLSITYNSGAYSFSLGSQAYLNYLVVGGGGGGGWNGGGGGGGGGILQNNTSSTSFSAATYSITVGAGGAGAVKNTINTGSNGSSSSIIGGSVSINALGGGGGGNSFGGQGSPANGNGAPSAASGGGGGFMDGAGGSGLVGQGNSGGTAVFFGTGGNGATGNGLAGGGGAGSALGTSGSRGGDGAANSITGSNIGQLSVNTYYVSGGGGGATQNGYSAPGGLGGGGNGDKNGYGLNLTAGTANTGGGGGGSYYSGPDGAAGGSGAVVLSGAVASSQGTYALTINSGAGKASIDGSVSNISTLTINSKASNSAVTGVIGGTTAVAYNTAAGYNSANGAAGILSLAGANTYTGGTTITGGTFQAGSATAFGGASGAITVNSGAALDLNGKTLANTNPLTLNSTGISGGGALTNSSSTAGTYAGNIVLGIASSIGSEVGDITASGVISGAFDLTKVGAATLTLTGANSYTGGTTVSAGTLQVGAGSTSGAIEGNVVNNATLAFDRSDALTYSGEISGTGGVTKAGSGTLLLSGANTYSGGTTVSAGALQAGHATAFGSGTIGVIGGAGLDLNGQAMTSTGALTLNGTGLSGGGALFNSIGAGASYAGLVNLATSSSIVGGSGAINLTHTGTITGSGFDLTLGGAQGGVLSGVIGTGTGSMTKQDAGTWAFKSVSTYSGGTTLNGGTLYVETSALTNPLGGGTITVNTGATLMGNLTAMTNAMVIAGGTLTEVNGFGGSYSGSVSLLGDMNISLASGRPITISGVISGAGGIIKTGNGPLRLTGDNTYTGDTTILAGTVKVGDNTSTGTLGAGNITNNGTLNFSRTNAITVSNAISGSGGVTQSGSGTLILSGPNTYTGATTLTAGTLSLGSAGAIGSSGTISFGGGTLQHTASNTTDYSSRLSTAASQAYKIDTNGQDVTLASALTSSGGTLNKLGSGTLLLSGANTYSGETTISAGTLQVGAGSTSGSIAGDVTNNAAISFNRSDALTYAGAISGTGAVTKLSAGVTTLTGASTYTGGTTISAGTLQVGAGSTSGSIAGDVTNNATLSFNRSDALTYAGAISGTGAVTKLAAGVTTLTGASTYTGGTTISAGTLQVGAGSTSGSIAGDVTNNATLSFNRSDALTYAGVISGTGAVSKLGSGTTTLSGGNTYSGVTTVSAGTLAITNATGLGATAGGVTVASGATLDLQGVSVGAEAITLNGGTLATSTGTSSLLGAVTLGADSTINVAGAASQLTLSGLVTGASALTKSGTGNLIMANQNTFSGGLTIAAGTATEATTYNGSTGPFGSGTVTVQTGATLDLNNYNIYVPVSLAGGALVNNATSGGVGQGDVSLGVNLTADSMMGGAGYINAFTAISSNGYGLVFLGTGTKNLSNVNNTLSTIASGPAVGGMNVTNNQALTIGQVVLGGTSYRGIDSTGTVAVSTRTGNLTVSQNVSTTSTSNNGNAPAIDLRAGTLTAAGTVTGGDLVLSGNPSFSMGVNALAVFYSGNSATTEATALISQLSANSPFEKVYNRDSSSNIYGSGFWAAFRGAAPITIYLLPVSGQSSIYGTAPTALDYCYSSSAASCVNVSYSGIPTSSQSFSLASGALSGAVNVASGVSGTLALTGSPSIAASGLVASTNAGTYALTLTPSLTLTGYNFSAGNAVNYTVNRKAVTLTNTARSTTYDGVATYAALANGASYSVNGLVGQDELASVTQAPSGHAGSALGVAQAGNFSVSPSAAVLSTGNVGNYDFIYGDSTHTVNKANATVTANSGTVTYNGANQTVSGFTATGLVAGQTQAVLTGVSASRTEKNAGSYAVSASGTDGNYNLSFVDGSLVINKANATVTANSASVTYNGANQTTSGFTATGLVGGETEAVLTGVSASRTAKNAGSYAVAASGTDGNYNLSFVAGSLDIAKAALTATGNSSAVTYNGAIQSVSGFTVTGLQGSDTVADLSSVVAAGATAKNAGSHANTVTAGTETNYTVTPVAGSLDIAKANATVTANSASVTYNGANQSVSGFTATGLVGGETEAVLTGISTSRTAKNAGSYAVAASGTDGNYNLAFVAGSLDIAKAALTATGNSSAVTYNGANQSVSGFTVAGLQGSDTVANLSSVVAAGATAKNAGSYANAVTAGTETNYTVTPVAGSLDIAKANATVTANSASVTYNGGSQTASGFTATGLVGGETEAVLTGVSASRSAKNAGSYAVVASGTDGNYNLSFVDGSLDIAKASLTATGNSSAVTYNGANQSVSGFTVTGLQGSDTVADLSSVVASGATAKNAGSYANAVTAGTETNYTVSTLPGSLDIAKANATVTANSASVTYNGANQTASGFTATGLVGGETEAVLTGVSASRSAKNAGSYAVVASGTDGNYNLSFVDGSLDIAKASLTATGNSSAVTYNGANQSVSGFTVTGLQGSDTVADLSNVVAAGATAKNAGSYANAVTAGTETNYTVSTLPGSLDIAKATATVTANSASVTYNGANQTASGFTATGLVGGETEAVLTGVSASRTAKNAGSYTNTASGTDGNYNLSFVAGSLDIAKAALSATGNSSAVTYNGANQSVSGFTVAGLQGSDTVADLINVVAAGATAKNAGSYANAVTAGTETNYTVTPVAGSLDIAKANATVTANSASVTYNGANQTASGFTATGLVGGETAAVLNGVSASRTAKNAGSYAVAASGTDGNYNLSFVNGSLDIAKAALSATGNSRTVNYNGANQSVSGFTVAGLQGSDTVADLSNVVAAGATAKNAGSYANAVTAGTETNYTVSTLPGSLDIAKATATVTANSASVTYNGANQSVSGFTATGLVGGETEAVLTGVSASRTAKNAGSYAVAASGTDGNYNLAFVPGSLDIAKAALTATGNSSAVTYNGANQSVSGFTVAGLQGSDTVGDLSNVVASGATAKNAGSYANTVTAGTETNYTVTPVAGSLDIAKANATVTANSASVTYNGANQTASGFTATGLVGGETAAVLNGVSASRTAKNAGSYAVAASGTDGNYNLAFVPGSLNIAKAALTATGNSSAVTYNGANQSVSGFTVAGLQGSDTVGDLSNVVASGATAKNAGSYANTVTAGTETNYTVTPVAGSLDIAKANATVTANSASVTYNGANQTASGFTATGLVGGETSAVLSGVTAPGATGKNAGTYASTASGSEGNYNLSFVDGALMINKANAKVTANSATLTYDGGNQTVSGFTASGLVGGETVAVLTGVSASRTAKNAGNYAVTASGSDGNYKLSFVDGAMLINPAPLVITAVTNTKSFDGNVQAQAVPVVSGLKGPDAVINLSEAYADANPGTGKTLSVQSGYQIVDGNNGNNYVVSLVPSQTGEIRALPVAVLAPALAVAPTGNSAPPTLTVLAASSAGASRAGSGSASSAGSGSAGGGSSVGVSVSTISSPSQQVTGLVAVLVPSGTATAGSGLVIALPEQVMTPAAAGAAVQVTLANGEPLPAWVRYDAATQTLVTSAVPAGAFPLSVVVTVGGQSTVVQISESQSNL